MGTFLYQGINLITQCNHPGRHQTIRHIITQNALRHHRLTTHIILSTFRLLTIIQPHRRIRINTSKHRTRTIHFIRMLISPLLICLIKTKMAQGQLRITNILLRALRILLTIISRRMLIMRIITKRRRPRQENRQRTTIQTINQRLLMATINHRDEQRIFHIKGHIRTRSIITSTRFPHQRKSILRTNHVFR